MLLFGCQVDLADVDSFPEVLDAEKFRSTYSPTEKFEQYLIQFVEQLFHEINEQVELLNHDVFNLKGRHLAFNFGYSTTGKSHALIKHDRLEVEISIAMILDIYAFVRESVIHENQALQEKSKEILRRVEARVKSAVLLEFFSLVAELLIKSTPSNFGHSEKRKNENRDIKAGCLYVQWRLHKTNESQDAVKDEIVESATVAHCTLRAVKRKQNHRRRCGSETRIFGLLAGVTMGLRRSHAPLHDLADHIGIKSLHTHFHSEQCAQNEKCMDRQTFSRENGTHR